MILSGEEAENYRIEGLEKALKVPAGDVRLFGKPTARKFRRMGVALASAKSTALARKAAAKVAGLVKVKAL